MLNCYTIRPIYVVVFLILSIFFVIMHFTSPFNFLMEPVLLCLFFLVPLSTLLWRKVLTFVEVACFVNPPYKGPWKELVSSPSRHFILCTVSTLLFELYVATLTVQNPTMYEAGQFFIVLLALSLWIAFLDLASGFSDLEQNLYLYDDLSIGAFWAGMAFNAYYQVILDDIVIRMTQFEDDKKLKFLKKKFVIIMPLSCNVSKRLDRNPEDNIEVIGELENIEHDQGANINRQYKSTVYKGKHPEDFYFVGEYASSLNTLWELRDTVDEFEEKKIGKMTKKEWIYQRDCFAKDLRHLLKDYPCIILNYDDQNKKEPLGTFIWSELNK